MNYSTKLIDNSDDRVTLRIEDDQQVREYTDRGEPEDQSFYRDWSWVPNELEVANKSGHYEGYKKAIFDVMSAIRKRKMALELDATKLDERDAHDLCLRALAVDDVTELAEDLLVWAVLDRVKDVPEQFSLNEETEK